jgi:hypothetical protein
MINGLLEEGGFKVMDEGIRELWNPDKEACKRCIDFGKEFVKNL